jgi:hypothetical protein
MSRHVEVFGWWLVAGGWWLLVFGCWLLVVGYSSLCYVSPHGAQEQRRNIHYQTAPFFGARFTLILPGVRKYCALVLGPAHKHTEYKLMLIKL